MTIQKPLPFGRRSSQGRPPSQPGARAELGEEEARKLLGPVDLLRDPLHGDIWLTKLERALVDTEQFQRLRNLMQLGMAHIVYPGAVHTRFLHSLGALHVCSELISTCNVNAETYKRLAPEGQHHAIPVKLTSYTQLLARLCALLHDLAHVPFGHTFDKEARIFPKDEWKDEDREKLVFGHQTDLVQTLKRFLTNTVSADEDFQRILIEDIKAVLRADTQEEILNLPYPFVHDLVGNTICADLVDYVKRDMLFSGLRENFGDRFLKFVAVFPLRVTEDTNKDTKREELQSDGVNEKFSLEPLQDHGHLVAFPGRRLKDKQFECCRVALMRYRYNETNKAVPKFGVFTEAVDLVRRRLTATEKIYYHRTKVVASAMLADAALEQGLKAQDIWDKSDRQVLLDLSQAKNTRVMNLARKVLARRLFKPIYSARYQHYDDPTSPAARVLNEAYNKYKDPVNRRELLLQLERILALELGLPPEKVAGTFSAYCPRKGGGVKELNMLVLEEPTAGVVRRLHVSRHKPTQLEIQAIQQAHLHLWKIEVFVDPEVLDLKRSNLIAARLAASIEKAVRPANEIEEFKNLDVVSYGDLDDYERRYTVKSLVAELRLTDDITSKDEETFADTMQRRPGNSPETREQLRERMLKLAESKKK